MKKNTTDIGTFLARIHEQATSSRTLSDYEIWTKELERIGAYADMKAAQYWAIMRKGLKNDLQYVAYMCGRSGIPYDMALALAKQKYGSQYSNMEELEKDFQDVYSKVPYDKEATERAFQHILNPNAAPEFPPVSFTSMVNGMNLKEAEMTMKALLGGWNRFCKLVDDKKQFNAMKRALEMFEYGFSSSYVAEYLSTLIDGSEIKAEDVPEMTRVTQEAAVKMGKLNTKNFDFGGRYK